MSDIDKHELTSFHRADDHALAPRPDSCCECANQKIRALGSEKAALVKLAQANKEEWGKEYARAIALDARVKELMEERTPFSLTAMGRWLRENAPSWVQGGWRKAEADLAALRDFIYKECDGNPENVAWILKRAAGRESGILAGGDRTEAQGAHLETSEAPAAKPAARYRHPTDASRDPVDEKEYTE